MSLSYVNPQAPRGTIYRALTALMGTQAALRLSRTRAWRFLVWRLDPYLMRLTRGRIGMGGMLPTALLVTRGARSGQVRRNAVIYFNDGERVTVVASKAGAPEHPSWFHNLRANPDVLLGGQRFRAEVVRDEAERARLWELGDRVFPAYAAYRRQAATVGRTIPIVQLIPRGS
ncbi:MAG TPA: nitroreductase/quinone reductase family protein [Solirubrobacteraceae bacterium]|jgi:deazaflavin-dependent oxidoreductase (nitroreductase family)|nr:nitroreductase/quinone reductase family protein [Solirubrobacteraceae bacterium]